MQRWQAPERAVIAFSGRVSEDDDFADATRGSCTLAGTRGHGSIVLDAVGRVKDKRGGVAGLAAGTPDEIGRNCSAELAAGQIASTVVITSPPSKTTTC